MKNPSVVRLEERTARLTILIDPRKKALFERLCSEEDLTSSQVVRRMIRGYIEEHLGRPWVPGEEEAVLTDKPVARGANKRRTSRP
ncbi:MAG TPA: hypothetical protein VGC34_10640 [Steroidobacteraceae bacterium]